MVTPQTHMDNTIVLIKYSTCRKDKSMDALGQCAARMEIWRMNALNLAGADRFFVVLRIADTLTQSWKIVKMRIECFSAFHIFFPADPVQAPGAVTDRSGPTVLASAGVLGSRKGGRLDTMHSYD